MSILLGWVSFIGGLAPIWGGLVMMPLYGMMRARKRKEWTVLWFWPLLVLAITGLGIRLDTGGNLLAVALFGLWFLGLTIYYPILLIWTAIVFFKKKKV